MQRLPRTGRSVPRPARRGGLALGLAVGLVAGVGLGASAPASMRDPDRSYRALRVFSQVFNYVENNYVDSVDQEKLVYGAIAGLTGTLDPYTVFLPPEQFQKIKEDTTGEFGGLGIEIGLKDGWLTIIAPIADSPAERAGLKAGDRIVAIEGRSAEGVSVADSVALLRGPPNTRITLTVMRQGWAEPREVALVRQKLMLNPVDAHLEGAGTGYVRIKSFQERTERELKKALDRLAREARARGRQRLDGLVLDLRDNPGGLVDEAVRVSDLFLDSGDIVTTEARNRRHVERQVAHQRGTQPPYPMVVLVNEGSASASEIVAGALQDQGRARVVGQRSYGKGSVQTIIELDDGSGLKLTVARYFTPSGRSINEHGIDPDLVVEPLQGEVELDASGGPARGAIEDRQLAAALEMLRGGLPVRAPGTAQEPSPRGPG